MRAVYGPVYGPIYGPVGGPLLVSNPVSLLAHSAVWIESGLTVIKQPNTRLEIQI